ncbi:aminoacyl-tRNA deacylase [Marinobacterium nitratireducens]|nr:YbaK/EbsC family protein [Marinobacterium nitratireducens]
MSKTVSTYLTERNVGWETLKHSETGSSEESARAAKIDQGHIAKAVMLQDGVGPVMVVIPGDSWVRLAAVNRELNRQLTLTAEQDSMCFFPDCKTGAIPPIGPAYDVETLLDESLLSLAYVYFEAGDHRSLVKVSGQDFLELLSGVRHGHFCDAQ